MRQVLMAHPGTKIVVTSAWVGSLGMKETMAAMLRNGFTPDDFHTDWNLPLAARRLGYDGIWQKVADDPSYRASWPAMWLTLHPQVNRYVVLDDQWIGRQIVYHPKALHDPQLRKRRPWIVADDGWNGKPDGNWVHVAAQDGVDILRPRHVQQAIRILERIPDDAQHVSRFEQ